MKQLKVTASYTSKKTNVNVEVPLLSFIEDKSHIIYCPALDLSGYGKTETEAKKSFEIHLHEYLQYTTNKNTLWIDLKKLGWTIKKNLKKPAVPPAMSHLLETNEEFNRIFNNYSYKKFDTGISLPAYA